MGPSGARMFASCFCPSFKVLRSLLTTPLVLYLASCSALQPTFLHLESLPWSFAERKLGEGGLAGDSENREGGWEELCQASPCSGLALTPQSSLPHPHLTHSSQKMPLASGIDSLKAVRALSRCHLTRLWAYYSDQSRDSLVAAGAREPLPILSPPRCLWGDGKKSLTPKKHTLNTSSHVHVLSSWTGTGRVRSHAVFKVTWGVTGRGEFWLVVIVSTDVSGGVCGASLHWRISCAETKPAKPRPAYHRVSL